MGPCTKPTGLGSNPPNTTRPLCSTSKQTFLEEIFVGCGEGSLEGKLVTMTPFPRQGRSTALWAAKDRWGQWSTRGATEPALECTRLPGLIVPGGGPEGTSVPREVGVTQRPPPAPAAVGPSDPGLRLVFSSTPPTRASLPIPHHRQRPRELRWLPVSRPCLTGPLLPSSPGVLGPQIPGENTEAQSKGLPPLGFLPAPPPTQDSLPVAGGRFPLPPTPATAAPTLA